jgi:hypothetical protein
MNPAVFCDPQVIPQLVPPRGRGRPTIYSQELIDEFCGLIVDGMTIARACKEAGMPSKRTIQYWLKKYPEFRCEFEESVQFRNQCWMDECVDIADDTASDARVVISEDGTVTVRMAAENTARRKLKCDMRWKQLRGAGLKVVAQPADNAEPIGEEKVQIVEHDPIHGQLYQWELEYQKRRLGRTKGPGRSPDGSRNGPNGQGG